MKEIVLLSPVSRRGPFERTWRFGSAFVSDELSSRLYANSRMWSNVNSTGSMRVTWRWGSFTKPLLLWISITYSVCVCVCSINYPACETHAPYCHLWPPWPYHIIRHFIKGAIVGNTSLNIKCVFWFSLQLLSKTFLILWRFHRDIVMNVKTSSSKVPVILVRF